MKSYWLLVMAVLFSGCVMNQQKPNTEVSTQNTEMANPASENCIRNGGVLVIQTDDKGNQFGNCVFEDGSSCDEWAFYRRECEKGQSLVKYNWKF